MKTIPKTTMLAAAGAAALGLGAADVANAALTVAVRVENGVNTTANFVCHDNAGCDALPGINDWIQLAGSVYLDNTFTVVNSIHWATDDPLISALNSISSIVTYTGAPAATAHVFAWANDYEHFPRSLWTGSTSGTFDLAPGATFQATWCNDPQNRSWDTLMADSGKDWDGSQGCVGIIHTGDLKIADDIDYSIGEIGGRSWSMTTGLLPWAWSSSSPSPPPAVAQSKG